MDYKAAGVDLVSGDTASTIMYEASRMTWESRKNLVGKIETPTDFFGAVRAVRAADFSDALLGINFDGVGTKIEIAERLGDHSTIANDLFAMVCDDAAIRGAEPLLFGSILDFSRISVPVVRQLALGMINAAKLARVAVMNGEVAELGSRVQGYSDSAYNWGGAVVWIGREQRLLTGSRIEIGDSIIAVRESGFRSNGISLVRKIFTSTHGPQWHTQSFGDGTLGAAVLHPSIIYTPLLVELSGGYCFPQKVQLAAAVHVTGGGVPGKLGRVLHGTNYGAELSDLFAPCSAMTYAQKLGKIVEEEAYRTWNMGQGLLLICREPQLVLELAGQSGFEARVAGVISETPGIRILSKGYCKPGSWLNFKGVEK